MAKREAEILDGRVRKTFHEAERAFFNQLDIEDSTLKRYARALNPLGKFLGLANVRYVDEITLDHLDNYRSFRAVAATTLRTEIQTLRQFFEFCLDREWVTRNVAKKFRPPREAKGRPREPYTFEEIIKIRQACETFGRGRYERDRALLMILLQRYYGFRVSDVATMRRDRATKDQIFIRALKNGAQVWLPMVEEVWEAMQRLPLPRGAGADCPYLFWNGNGSKVRHINDVGRTLQAVFRASGVENAISHRFRHTLATEILAKGGTLEDAANVLGDEPATIRKHYAKYSVTYQTRLNNVMLVTWGTNWAQSKKDVVNPVYSIDRLVQEVGVEPTCQVNGAGF